MSEALVPATAEPVVVEDREGELVLPQVIVDAGPDAVARFLEFFAARIANERTRAAYGRAVGQFLGWCEARGLGLGAIAPLHVAAYIRTHPGSVPTVKQHLAAIRVLCDWLVVSQVLPANPAAAVRGPKHVVTKGATPVLTPAEARKLLEHIDTGTLAGLRDRALFSVMLYSFARVSAVLGMRRQDELLAEGGGLRRPALYSVITGASMELFSRGPLVRALEHQTTHTTDENQNPFLRQPQNACATQFGRALHQTPGQLALVATASSSCRTSQSVLWPSQVLMLV